MQQHRVVRTLRGVLLLVLLLAGAVAAQQPATEAKPEQFVPILIYRTGPYAAGGSGIMGGFMDYMALINTRDGGINGIPLLWEECETAYSNDRGVECYERLKGKGSKGAPVMNPLSTGITYALIERASSDKIPIVSLGYGRTDASDGRVFPYVFPLITNYWNQSSAKVRYLAQLAGGEEKLRGKKIVNLHLNVPYGKETIPIWDNLAAKLGFEVKHLAVPPPGIDQKALWLQIREFNPDWVINRNYGVSCTEPLREAARIGFPRDKILGVWWCGSEEDVLPAAKAARGYMTTNFHGIGRDFPVIEEIIDTVYGPGKGNLPITRVGSVYYNRGVIHGIITVEAIRLAHTRFGVAPIGGEHMQWALEHLDLTAARIKDLGAEGLMFPLKTSCQDHEGGGAVLIQQWDGDKWVKLSDWIQPYSDMVRAEIEKSAAQYARDKGIIPRDCK
ncbi:MAG: ABC transporter substrate-binding protein [Candidatus Tectimicrobiota bacterium]